jgi:hypothetical protein
VLFRSLSISQIAWIVLLLAGSLSRNFRKKLFVWLILFSIVCGLCWFLNPIYTPTIQGILSNDYLAYFVLMIIISLFFGSINNSANRRVELFCQNETMDK